ncbi:MAG: sugar transferase [Candidatus Binatia bacterium]
MVSLRRQLLALLKIADLSVVTGSFIVAVAASGGATGVSGWLEVLQMRIQFKNVLFVAVYLALWHVVLRCCDLYRSYRLSGISRELRDLGTAVAIATAPLVPLTPVFHFHYVTAPFLAAFAGLAFLGLSIERRVLRVVGARVRHYGRNLRNVLIVGIGNDALDLTSKLARREDLGYSVVGIIDAGEHSGASDSASDGKAILEKVEAMIEAQPIDEVFVGLPLDTSQPLIRSLIAICEQQGITIRVLAHVASLYWARARIDELEGQPVLTMYTGRPDALGLLGKRVIDIAGATLGLVLLAPLFLLAAVAIKLESRGGPVFFVQRRVGLNRRRFYALKFRTMTEDAEELQSALEPLNEAEGPVFKIENDPRVTRVGRWLRQLSIDELPQLVNVLKGEMSLVGPRPLPVRDANRIDVRWHKRRFSVKPGITCLWQVNSRRPKFDEWIKWDMEYIDNWSLGLDFKILAKTIPAVLSGQGAH